MKDIEKLESKIRLWIFGISFVRLDDILTDEHLYKIQLID
jgi:hypothetical protein